MPLCRNLQANGAQIFWDTLYIEEDHCVDIIYVDFAKTFDSVPHERLLRKIESYGIGGNVLNWIKSFLCGRKQRVVLNGFKSSWSNVVSGVPQGSVLGPLLFLLYVNDLPECIKNRKVAMFADDLKLYSTHVSNDDKIQYDISNVEKWSSAWQLRLNNEKCHFMQLGRKKSDQISY